MEAQEITLGLVLLGSQLTNREADAEVTRKTSAMAVPLPKRHTDEIKCCI